MNKTLVFAVALLVLLMTLAGALMASGSNLCDSGNAWDGSCTTQRHWEAGWCFANQPSSTCSALYSDVLDAISGAQSAGSGAAGANSANSQTGANGSQQNAPRTATPSSGDVSPTSTPFCRVGWDCSVWPPVKLPATPTRRVWPTCAVGTACGA